MLGHVIENACQHATATVVIQVESDFIAVEDDGPGIPAAQYETVLRRGGRLDATRPGSGIGLAVVQDIVELYHGELRLDAAAGCRGLRVELRLPLAR